MAAGLLLRALLAEIETDLPRYDAWIENRMDAVQGAGEGGAAGAVTPFRAVSFGWRRERRPSSDKGIRINWPDQFCRAVLRPFARGRDGPAPHPDRIVARS